MKILFKKEGDEPRETVSKVSKIVFRPDCYEISTEDDTLYYRRDKYKIKRIVEEE